MSVATDTARVGSLAGSPTMKRLGAAIAMVALAASIVGASALLAPNSGPAPEPTGVTEEVRQTWISKNAAISGVYATRPVVELPGVSGGPHERLAGSTAIGSIAGGTIPGLSAPAGSITDLASGLPMSPDWLTEVVYRSRTEATEASQTPKPFVERPGAPK